MAAPPRWEEEKRIRIVVSGTRIRRASHGRGVRPGLRDTDACRNGKLAGGVRLTRCGMNSDERIFCLSRS